MQRLALLALVRCSVSHVQDDVRGWAGAADGHLVGRRCFQRFEADAAAPDSGGVTQVWQTPVRHHQRVGTAQALASSSSVALRVPRHAQTAADEGDQGTGSGSPCGWRGSIVMVGSSPGLIGAIVPNGSMWIASGSRPKSPRLLVTSAMK